METVDGASFKPHVFSALMFGSGQAQAIDLTYNLQVRNSILCALAAVLLLLASPLDCFSQLANELLSPCCASRHCNPAGQSRACCQVKLFQTSQYFQAAKKSPLPALDFSAAPAEPVAQFRLLADFSNSLAGCTAHAPPGGPCCNTNLPLLI